MSKATGLFRALRDAPFERESLGAVGAGGDDGARGNQQARTGNDALVDGLLQLDIGVAGALGAEVAHGGETGHQRGAQVVDGARGAQSEALMQDLVVPGGLVVGMQHDVRMALDQARHQRGAGQLDGLGAGGIDAGGGPRGFDAVAGHTHGPTFMHGLAVEDARRLQQHGGGRLRLGRQRSRCEEETDGKGTVE